MIARIWRGVVRAAHADEYYRYLEETGLKEYRNTPGNRGLQVLRSIQNDRCEYVLITFWENWEAIRRFAGDTPEKAVYYPRDREFLLELEPNVQHFEVVD
jgi:heme-degrading monooxygenase HmoA